MTAAQVVPAIVVPLIAWRVYSRFKRNVGRQPFQPRRLKARVILFSAITVLLVFAVMGNPSVLGALLGGLVAGVLLAQLGLKLTRFELKPDGEFYIPNTAIGVGLTLLLVGRVLYRIIVLLVAPPVQSVPTVGMFQSPLTLGVFGLNAGYFITYNVGLVLQGTKIAHEGTRPS